jgi:hypothetical protein
MVIQLASRNRSKEPIKDLADQDGKRDTGVFANAMEFGELGVTNVGLEPYERVLVEH